MTDEERNKCHDILDSFGVENKDGGILDRLKLISPFQVYANQNLVNENKSKREEILREAIQCVTKDRNATHGDPEDNFGTIAGLWNVFLDERTAGDLTAVDVATMMILMKVSRILTSPEHQDHWVDIAGYAACGGEISTKNKG